MTKTIFIVGLLLLLISCEKPEDNCQTPNKPLSTSLEKEDEAPVASEGCSLPDDPSDGDVDPGDGEAPSDDVPAEAFLFDADVSLFEFDTHDETKVMKAISIIKKVIRTSEFRQRVLNFTYNGQKKFVDNDGLTNEQIYQKLLDGAEDLRPEVDNQMDLELELYYSSRSTVGYTYASGLRIWMNTKFFDAYTPSEVAGNVFHEWTHKLGFSHASSYSVSRDSSVPYALGYLIEELGKKYE